MSVRISSTGVLETQDNRQNLGVDGTVSVGGAVTVGGSLSLTSGGVSLTPTPLSGAAPKLTTPGMYTIYGNINVTASLPSPAIYPGSMWIIQNDSGPTGLTLSGSSITSDANFFRNSSTQGNTAAMPARSSVVLIAVGLSYLVTATSGTITVA